MFRCFSLMVLLCLWAASFSGCREVPADQVYALHLTQPPVEGDWLAALPRYVTVKGGRPHRMTIPGEVDDDTVHVTTAACHHGATLPTPIEVDLRAFYTDTELFLRLSWADATRDDAMMQWEFDGATWHNSAGLEDGLGLFWASAAEFPRFSCSMACHIDNFGVSGANFHATSKMKLAQPERSLDLWHWKAGRTGHLGFADDRYLDQAGMHGDLSGELFRENSQALLDGSVGDIFTAADRPLYDSEGLPLGKAFRPPGTRAPGFLVERPVGFRADVTAESRYAQGRWTVVLRRALQTGDSHDLEFVPGAESAVLFGLAIMDNTLREHFASTTLERLRLLPKAVQ